VKTESNNDRPGRIYRFLILLQFAVALVALIVAFASAHNGRQERDRNQSTFERQTPDIPNWPKHSRPFPRG
jgi:hypothetical protein